MSGVSSATDILPTKEPKLLARSPNSPVSPRSSAATRAALAPYSQTGEWPAGASTTAGSWATDISVVLTDTQVSPPRSRLMLRSDSEDEGERIVALSRQRCGV